MKEINENDLLFVAEHYDTDALDTERAWQKLQKRVDQAAHAEAPTPPPAALPMTASRTSVRRLIPASRRIAATVGILLVVGASVACGFWYAHHRPTTDAPSPSPTSTSVDTPYRYVRPTGESVVLSYDNAPIDDVLSELSDYYSRQLVLHDAAEDRCITGEIEATTLEEIIEILEETLDVKIEMK